MGPSVWGRPVGLTFPGEWTHGRTRRLSEGIAVAVSCEHPSELLSDVHFGEAFGPGRVLSGPHRPL